MARLPKPIEWVWTIFLFSLIGLMCIGFVLSSILILYPLIGTWNMTLWMKCNILFADITWTVIGSKGLEGWAAGPPKFYGEHIPVRENAIVIMNHLTFLDWAFVFPIAGRRGRLGMLKFFAKKSVSYFPGFGWGLHLLDSIFVNRNWTDDRKTIEEAFSTLKARRLPFWTVSFLEGTRQTPTKLKESQEYSKSKNLPVLNHILFPRTKGFIATVQGLRDTADAVYDITFAFEGNKIPSPIDIAMRRMPRLHYHFRRWKISDLPEDPAKLNEWTVNVWIEKDKLLDHFKKHGVFPQPCKDGEWSVPFKKESMLLSTVPLPLEKQKQD